MEQTFIDMAGNSQYLTPPTIQSFQSIIYQYYQNHGRKFPWRRTNDPYHILISEIMLQQTQTDRAIGKYLQFIKVFPDFQTLAEAPLRNILKQWQGLGYNRRAVSLKQLSEIVSNNYHGILPKDINDLKNLSGIGPYTAAAICAFAFNQPVVFIETNIRTVMLYFFFQGKSKVKDQEILIIIKKTLDLSNPREWYYALMDYGSMLKKKFKYINKQSAHYQKQSPFQGSNRQIRGKIIKTLLIHTELSPSELSKIIKIESTKLEKIISQLEKEKLINIKNNKLKIV